MFFAGTLSAQTQYIMVCDCGSATLCLKYRAQQPRTCTKCDVTQRLRRKPSPRRLTPGDASFNALLNGYVYGAKSRGLTFEISREEFASLTKRDCFYCGAAPSAIRNTKRVGVVGYCDTYIYNGVDRANPKIGYVAGNVVPCCKLCNYIKRSMTQGEFYSHIERILARRSK
jgi:hypothetical protein